MGEHLMQELTWVHHRATVPPTQATQILLVSTMVTILTALATGGFKANRQRAQEERPQVPPCAPQMNAYQITKRLVRLGHCGRNCHRCKCLGWPCALRCDLCAAREDDAG